MKILHVIASLNPEHGGPMQGLRNYLPEIYNMGYRNEVVCLDDPAEPFIGKDSFITHALGPCQRPWAYAGKLLPWLKKELPRFQAVMIHGLWLYHGYAVLKAVKWLEKQGVQNVPRIFVMPHGMLDPYFQNAPERRLKAIRNNIYWKFIEKDITNNATAMLFTCQEELRLARQTFRTYRPKKELNIGYGIATPPAFHANMKVAFLEHCPPTVKDQPFLLFLSRVHQKKGIDLLLKAYAAILQAQEAKGTDGATLPFLLVAGPGMDTPYGQSLNELVTKLGLEAHVFFPGMLSGDAKWGAFYACEAFVLPSHQENFGIAVAEALACSKPVLISNQVNIWREIKQAGAGFVAENTLAGTTSLVRNWTEMSAEKKKNVSAAARLCFERNFDVETAAKRMMQQVLKNIVQRQETV
ncbi:glycosyltransferase [Flavisolibacter sp. BT320]|nr:glycosyltransferase [Flavisolibacter longurius]